MDFDKKLKKLEDSIDEYIIDMYEPSFFNMPIRLACYELNGYEKLTVELNRAIKSHKT